MEIRKAKKEEIEVLMRIFEEARSFMRSYGNTEQWQDGYPPRELILEDIEKGRSYVAEENGEILASFMYDTEGDPAYESIEGGSWPDDEPYAVVHRIASKRGSNGIGAYCLDWAYNASGSLRIDTHKDNIPMRRLLEKLGFQFCGIVDLGEGKRRMAFSRKKNLRF